MTQGEMFSDLALEQQYDNIIKALDMKQETLEEAAVEFVRSHDFSLLTNPNHLANRCFQFGAKWQAERMYSEEEVRTIANDAYSMGRNNILIGVFNKWFEQFKKK